jgi:Uma2 family endonuclease
VSYYGYAKLPKGAPLPEGYPHVPPDLVFEVISPHDRWPKVLAKVAEYLEAGVAVVALLDPERRTLRLYDGDQPDRILVESDELTLPDLLGDFRVAVGRFFA